MSVHRINPDLIRPLVTTLSDREPTLEEAQNIVGGCVELVELPDGRQLLADEDDIAKGLLFNRTASMLADRRIVGPVLILAGTARWLN